MRLKWLEEHKSGEDILIAKAGRNKGKEIEPVLAQRGTAEVKADVGISQNRKGGVPFTLLQRRDDRSRIGGTWQKTDGIDHHVGHSSGVSLH